MEVYPAENAEENGAKYLYCLFHGSASQCQWANSGAYWLRVCPCKTSIILAWIHQPLNCIHSGVDKARPVSSCALTLPVRIRVYVHTYNIP